MKTHTAVAIDAASGRRLGEKTVAATGAGTTSCSPGRATLDGERRFAIEDCRHVSGRLERHLLPRGERLVRVPPKLMAGARSSARTYGKSDPIDAECVARAALREPDLPEASLAGPEHDVRLLVDHRDDLVGERSRMQKRLRWHAPRPRARPGAAASGARPLRVARPRRRRHSPRCRRARAAASPCEQSRAAASSPSRSAPWSARSAP